MLHSPPRHPSKLAGYLNCPVTQLASVPPHPTIHLRVLGLCVCVEWWGLTLDAKHATCIFCCHKDCNIFFWFSFQWSDSWLVHGEDSSLLGISCVFLVQWCIESTTVILCYCIGKGFNQLAPDMLVILLPKKCLEMLGDKTTRLIKVHSQARTLTAQ